MENNNTMTAKNPWEDQRKAALELYEDMCAKSHHWSSFIQRAIEAYKESESRASHPEPMEVEKEGPWRYEAKTWGIADTGDYDGHYEITNGKILLISKDQTDDDNVFTNLVNALNQIETLYVEDHGKEWQAGFENGYNIGKSEASIAQPECTLQEDADKKLYNEAFEVSPELHPVDKQLWINGYITGAKHLNKKEVAEKAFEAGACWAGEFLSGKKVSRPDKQTYLNSL